MWTICSAPWGLACARRAGTVLPGPGHPRSVRFGVTLPLMGRFAIHNWVVSRRLSSSRNVTTGPKHGIARVNRSCHLDSPRTWGWTAQRQITATMAPVVPTRVGVARGGGHGP